MGARCVIAGHRPVLSSCAPRPSRRRAPRAVPPKDLPQSSHACRLIPDERRLGIRRTAGPGGRADTGPRRLSEGARTLDAVVERGARDMDAGLKHELEAKVYAGERLSRADGEALFAG